MQDQKFILSKSSLFNAVSSSQLSKIKSHFKNKKCNKNDSDVVMVAFTAVKIGDIDIIKYLYDSELFDSTIINKDDEDKGLLYCAIEKGNVALVEYFLKIGFNPNTVFDSPGSACGLTPLFLATIKRYEIVVDLLIAEPTCNINKIIYRSNTKHYHRYTKYDGMQALHAAIITGNLNLTKKFVNQENLNNSIKSSDMHNNMSPIALAIKLGKYNIVKFLIEEMKCDLDVLNYKMPSRSKSAGCNLLIYAILEGFYDVVLCVLQNIGDRVDYNKLGTYQNLNMLQATLIHTKKLKASTQSSRLKLFKYLCEKAPSLVQNIETKCKRGYLTLLELAFSNHHSLVIYFLQKHYPHISASNDVLYFSLDSNVAIDKLDELIEYYLSCIFPHSQNEISKYEYQSIILQFLLEFFIFTYSVDRYKFDYLDYIDSSKEESPERMSLNFNMIVKKIILKTMIDINAIFPIETAPGVIKYATLNDHLQQVKAPAALMMNPANYTMSRFVHKLLRKEIYYASIELNRDLIYKSIVEYIAIFKSMGRGNVFHSQLGILSEYMDSYFQAYYFDETIKSRLENNYSYWPHILSSEKNTYEDIDYFFQFISGELVGLREGHSSNNVIQRTPIEIEPEIAIGEVKNSSDLYTSDLFIANKFKDEQTLKNLLAEVNPNQVIEHNGKNLSLYTVLKIIGLHGLCSRLVNHNTHMFIRNISDNFILIRDILTREIHSGFSFRIIINGGSFDLVSGIKYLLTSILEANLSYAPKEQFLEYYTVDLDTLFAFSEKLISNKFHRDYHLWYLSPTNVQDICRLLLNLDIMRFNMYNYVNLADVNSYQTIQINVDDNDNKKTKVIQLQKLTLVPSFDGITDVFGYIDTNPEASTQYAVAPEAEHSPKDTLVAPIELGKRKIAEISDMSEDENETSRLRMS